MTALHARAGAFVAIGGLLGAFGFLACSDDPADDPRDGGNGAVDAEPLFRKVQNDLIFRCGGPNGSCHVRGPQAPHWLGDPDPYISAKKYPGILPATRDVGDSIILTQVAHAGPSLKSFPNLYNFTADWLRAEVPQPPLPSTGAFSVVTGYNSINMNAAGPGLEGARLTFLATDGAAGTISLSAIRVFAPQNANVKITDPFFVILPRNGKVKAEPAVNGFQGELTVPAGTAVELFTGRMILTRWDPTGQMKVVFTGLESTPGTGPVNACTALNLFTSQALPAMRMPVQITEDDDNDGGVADGGVIGTGSCIGCHGQADDPVTGSTSAVRAMDLRAADTDPAIACGQARNMINFQNKAQSLILLNPTGKANPNHPIRALADNDPIINGIRAWVEAETQ
ncbi:MAG: hypothetical protein KF819_18560 [Labilithrix sp.]|nr:hypothetical protein [Labilithrix sp.]